MRLEPTQAPWADTPMRKGLGPKHTDSHCSYLGCLLCLSSAVQRRHSLPLVQRTRESPLCLMLITMVLVCRQNISQLTKNSYVPWPSPSGIEHSICVHNKYRLKLLPKKCRNFSSWDFHGAPLDCPTSPRWVGSGAWSAGWMHQMRKYLGLFLHVALHYWLVSSHPVSLGARQGYICIREEETKDEHYWDHCELGMLAEPGLGFLGTSGA